MGYSNILSACKRINILRSVVLLKFQITSIIFRDNEDDS